MLDLSAQRTQVALRDGSALFDVGSLSSGNLFEVATPCGAVDFQQPGLYQIAINENGNAVATVLSGEAQVVGHGGSGKIQKGEYLAVPCQGSNEPAIISQRGTEPGRVRRGQLLPVTLSEELSTDVIAITTRISTILITTTRLISTLVTITSTTTSRGSTIWMIMATGIMSAITVTSGIRA